MSTLRFVVEVDTERVSGKFASRDEISEKISEAIASGLEDVDLSGLGADSDSEYEATGYGVEEVDNKQLKAEWKENEHRVREELPGDAQLRLKVKALTAEVRTKVEAIRALQREIAVLHEHREVGKTNVYAQDGFEKPKTYLPDGVFDRVCYQFGPRDDERFCLSRTGDGDIEIRMDTMGVYQLMVQPRSGNVLLIKAVPQ